MKYLGRLLRSGVPFVIFFSSQVLFAQKDTVRIKTEKVKEIDEVVVVGYQKRKVSELTGSVQKLKTAEINSPAAQTVESTLQGRAAGVQITATSGNPGAVQDVRIRGVGSINASARPLYVIDGVPMIDQDLNEPLVDATQGATQSRSSFSSLASINNEDIESVTVLKDAGSTAQYGARGANGVILITTKRGKKGKARYSFESTVGFQNDAYNELKPLTGDQRLMLLQEGLVNQNYAGITKSEEALNFIRQNNVGNYNVWEAGGKRNYNWQDAIRRKNAPLQSYNFSAAGGGDKNTYYASLGYNDTQGTAIGPSFQRMSGMLRYTSTLSDKVKLETSVNGSYTRQNPIYDQAAYYANPYLAMYMISPWASPYLSDGSPNPYIAGFSDVFNPLYTLKNDVFWVKVARVFTVNKLEWKVWDRLTFSQTINLDYSNSDYKYYGNRVMGDEAPQGGGSTRSFTQNFTYVSQSGLHYFWNMGDKNRFDATGLMEYQKFRQDYLYGYGTTFATDGLTNIDNAAANYQAGSRMFDWKNIAFLGLLNYSYDNKLILNASFRREGSSRFAPGKRYGSFASLGAAYNLHKDFFGDIFDELKLRSSYGTSGNSNITLNSYQSFLSYNSTYAGRGGAYPSLYGNSNLTWEKQRMFDLGVDFSLFESKLSGSIGYFNKKTYDLLMSVPLPTTSGFSSQYQNVGTVVNSGLEIQLSQQVIKTENFSWSLFQQISPLSNKVTQLAKDAQGRDIDPNAGSAYRSTRVGEPIRSWYLRKWAGVDPATGAPLWYKNGVDGETTGNYNTAELALQGSPIPKYTGGFGTDVKYKDWFLKALFSFAGGHKIYDYYGRFFMANDKSALASGNGYQELLGRWQKPGDVTDVPKLSYSNNDFSTRPSTRFLYQGDYLRLRDLQVGYSLSGDFLKSTGIEMLSLSVRGTNLLTWVKDKRLKLDPEVAASGFTSLTTPPVKSILFVVNIKL
ncbi:MAG: SusC/RagA family TonB-linked outer membrane protein [Bergeyella sp.]|nr:SusC/RagA family TonB-linked outer membrane protein [Bergeyella sp.]